MRVWIELPIEESGWGSARVAKGKLEDAWYRCEELIGSGPKMLLIIGDQADAAAVLGMGLVPRGDRQDGSPPRGR